MGGGWMRLDLHSDLCKEEGRGWGEGGMPPPMNLSCHSHHHNFHPLPYFISTLLICHRQNEIFTVPSLLSRHQLDSEAEDTKISYKMHTQVRRMMSEKRQRKKNVKTGEGEPQIKVTEEVEGRVSGPAKTLMDANVYDVMAKEEVPPPPPYTSNSGGKTRTSASFRLTGQT